MIEVIVDIVLGAMALYLLLGVFFSLFFYARGAKVIDEGTVDTPWHFKLIIFPGVVLFWVALMAKLIRKK